MMRKPTPRIVNLPCVFCKEEVEPNYKEFNILKKFLSDRSKIIPSLYTGTCMKHQRLLSTSIKRARSLGLLPYVPEA